MTTTVYFDLDGTLIGYTTPFADIFAQTLPNDVPEEVTDTYFEEVLSGITHVKENPYLRAVEIVGQKYELDVNPKEIAEIYIEKEAAATRILPAVRQLVERVSSQHQTGILTNGDGRMQRQKLEKHGLANLVDTVIVSNEVGSRKPDQAIFEEAKKRLPAETFVYVGDTYDEDIVPALQAGFTTVYVGEDHQPDAPVAARGTEELAELLLALVREDTVN